MGIETQNNLPENLRKLEDFVINSKLDENIKRWQLGKLQELNNLYQNVKFKQVIDVLISFGSFFPTEILEEIYIFEELEKRFYGNTEGIIGRIKDGELPSEIYEGLFQ